MASERELMKPGPQRPGRELRQLCFNAKFRRTGHLWGDRFWVRLVDDEKYLVEVCEYVVNNPVRAGLVARAADWPWSASRYGFT